MTAHAFSATTTVFFERLYKGWTDQAIAARPDGADVLAIRAAVSAGTLAGALAERAEDILRTAYPGPAEEAGAGVGAIYAGAIAECLAAQDGCGRPAPLSVPTRTTVTGAMPGDVEARELVARMRAIGAHVVVQHGPCGEISRLQVLGGATEIDAHWVGPSYAAVRMRAWLEKHSVRPVLPDAVQDPLHGWRAPWTVLGLDAAPRHLPPGDRFAMADEEGGDRHDLRPPAPGEGGAFDPWISYGWPYVVVTAQTGKMGYPGQSWVAYGIQNRAAADMIAAAPEMLAALKALLADPDNYFASPADGELLPALAAAYAAVAKAEGRAEPYAGPRQDDRQP